MYLGLTTLTGFYFTMQKSARFKSFFIVFACVHNIFARRPGLKLCLHNLACFIALSEVKQMTTCLYTKICIIFE